MLQGFEAVKDESAGGKKSTNCWRLTDDAWKHGIQSTTRYRRHGKSKRVLHNSPPASQRQRSGSKGGKATKVSAKYRQPKQDEVRKERLRKRSTALRRQQKGLRPPTPSALPYQALTSPRAANQLPMEPYDVKYAVGCDPYSPATPLFCEMDGTEPEYCRADPVSMGCGVQSIPHGLWMSPEYSDDIHAGL